ncbi:hypothetical protein TSUD_360640 [Trifolium subterraneum]|uniref:Uncharacterized protein n=1 Tax=Trifolium subterraneum TaxID=3900 RepID=A0A2Z6NE14_TRISU|nr:hypothetical protein TSUD_360640 [Trifolium subterraneum]
MENQNDVMNQRLGNVEATMEQIIQLLLERNERSSQRQRRMLGRRDHRNDEGEWIVPAAWVAEITLIVPSLIDRHPEVLTEVVAFDCNGGSILRLAISVVHLL